MLKLNLCRACIATQNAEMYREYQRRRLARGYTNVRTAHSTCGIRENPVSFNGEGRGSTLLCNAFSKCISLSKYSTKELLASAGLCPLD